MLEFIASLVIGWNLVSPHNHLPPDVIAEEGDCNVAVVWWWHGDEWHLWDASREPGDNEFYMMLRGEAYWVYCEDDAIQHR